MRRLVDSAVREVSGPACAERISGALWGRVYMQREHWPWLLGSSSWDIPLEWRPVCLVPATFHTGHTSCFWNPFVFQFPCVFWLFLPQASSQA